VLDTRNDRAVWMDFLGERVFGHLQGDEIRWATGDVWRRAARRKQLNTFDSDGDASYFGGAAPLKIKPPTRIDLALHESVLDTDRTTSLEGSDLLDDGLAQSLASSTEPRQDEGRSWSPQPAHPTNGAGHRPIWRSFEGSDERATDDKEINVEKVSSGESVGSSSSSRSLQRERRFQSSPMNKQPGASKRWPSGHSSSGTSDAWSSSTWRDSGHDAPAERRGNSTVPAGTSHGWSQVFAAQPSGRARREDSGHGRVSDKARRDQGVKLRPSAFVSHIESHESWANSPCAPNGLREAKKPATDVFIKDSCSQRLRSIEELMAAFQARG